jgi:hypothetical protein
MPNQMLDWEILNQDNYWKQNWPTYHPTPAGLEWTSSHQCTSSGWGRSSCFGDEPKTHPLPLFFQPLLCPKILLSYLPPPPSTSFLPTSLTSFRAHFISWAWVTQSFQEIWDTRLKGRWRSQHWRNVKRRRQEEYFIPNAKAREER